jgi:hypothetical protein
MSETKDARTRMTDLLVALGYLPERFSSAYRAGFGRGREFQTYASNWQGGTDYAQSLLPAPPIWGDR